MRSVILDLHRYLYGFLSSRLFTRLRTHTRFSTYSNCQRFAIRNTLGISSFSTQINKNPLGIRLFVMRHRPNSSGVIAVRGPSTSSSAPLGEGGLKSHGGSIKIASKVPADVSWLSFRCSIDVSMYVAPLTSGGRTGGR